MNIQTLIFRKLQDGDKIPEDCYDYNGLVSARLTIYYFCPFLSNEEINKIGKKAKQMNISLNVEDIENFIISELKQIRKVNEFKIKRIRNLNDIFRR